MITRGFIEKVHLIFDELNYHEMSSLNFASFEKSAINTLTHSKELSDAIETVLMYQFCLKKWNKIEKLFRRKLDLFNEYDYEGNSLISTISDDDSLGTYFITNGINRKIKEVFVASYSFDNEMFALGFKNGGFSVFDDGNYYIKYSKMSSTKMKLFNNRKDCLCTIVLSENCDIFLENNLTPYEIILNDNFIGIYERKYIDSLNDPNEINPEKLVADIEWDILEKKSDLGLAKMNLYSSDQDLEMLLLFATSTFLIFQKFMSSQKEYNGFRAGMMTGMFAHRHMR